VLLTDLVSAHLVKSVLAPLLARRTAGSVGENQ
jgi:hypothetical protein